MGKCLGEWIEEANAGSLEKDVEAHLEGTLGPIPKDDRDSAVRCIMISIRQWVENRV
jgi:hypothetical protein